MTNKYKNNNFSVDDLIKGLGDTINSKINESNFADLNETVKRSIDIALDQVNNSIIGKNVLGRQANVRTYNRGFGSANMPEINQVERYIRRPENYLLNLIFQILSGITAFIMLILGIILLAIGLNFIPFFIIFGVMFGISYFFSYRRKEISRFKAYLASLDHNGYAEISSMANSIGRPESSVVKDLENMIDKKYFYQGHLVENNTIFLVNDELYSYYKAGQESRRKRDIEQEKFESNKELNHFLESCRDNRNEIEVLQRSLSDTGMVEKCSEISYLIGSLEDLVSKNPDKLDRLDRFSSYYMPITTKLLGSYKDLENKPKTDTSLKAMDEISTTMDTIIGAYKRLLDQLIQTDNIDIRSDISVLKTMLAQDGLSGESPFENKIDE